MNMPLLMQSLPNSGSTWFASVLAQSIPDTRYFMEFFNPAQNADHEYLLSTHFGCELCAYYPNIAIGDDEGIDHVIEATWGSENYNFTKEVFSPFKTEVFTRHFNVFVFLRREQETFPPNRGRVWCFYEHAWFALERLGYPLHGDDMRSRAIEAFHVMYRRIIEDATALDIPIIWWHDLFNDPHEMAHKLRPVFGDRMAPLLKAIERTRERRPRPAAA